MRTYFHAELEDSYPTGETNVKPFRTGTEQYTYLSKKLIKKKEAHREYFIVSYTSCYNYTLGGGRGRGGRQTRGMDEKAHGPGES